MGFGTKRKKSESDLQMLARPPQLLLRVRVRNGEATHPVSCFVLLFLPNPRPLYPQGAAVLRSVETQLHCTVEQIGDDVLGFIDLFVVLLSLRLQRAQMQRRFIFALRVRNQMLVFGEIQPRPLHIAHGFVEQSQVPLRQRKLGSHAFAFPIYSRALISSKNRNFCSWSHRGSRTGGLPG